MRLQGPSAQEFIFFTGTEQFLTSKALWQRKKNNKKINQGAKFSITLRVNACYDATRYSPSYRQPRSRFCFCSSALMLPNVARSRADEMQSETSAGSLHPLHGDGIAHEALASFFFFFLT